MYYSEDTKITPKLTENALHVLKKRYLRGETPEEMFWRVAKAVAAEDQYLMDTNDTSDAGYIKEKLAINFYNMMASLDFLPNSPTLMNAGRPLGQLAACFVVPVEDSMEGIFNAIKDMAMIQKTGGGTGFSFSKLRPKDDPVSSTNGDASGPVSFMHAFNACTEVVKQGGARRGANMGILRVDHPDIIDFIDAKSDLNQLTNFNVSVAITDEFMHCLFKNKPFMLRFNGVDYAEIDPWLLMNKMVHRAWSTGEPGWIFIDKINRDNPTPTLGEIEATNPCGEQPLLPYEACNLGSINLANMIKQQPFISKVPADNIDWEHLKIVTWIATRFLDNIIDVNHYPLPQIKENVQGNRKIGLGIMGWGDLLYRIGVPYDSEDARQLAMKIMQFIQTESHLCSTELAQEKGCFPNWKESVWGQQGIPMRNATTVTIAPTGTLSVVASVSSGVEPLFGLYYEKDLSSGTIGEGRLTVLNEHLLAKLNEAEMSQEKIDYIIGHLKKTGSLKGLGEYYETVLADICDVFKVASDIDPLDHIRMQAAFQMFTDNAVSKTINFNNDVSEEQILNAVIEAWKLDCKGLTIYRDGSRSFQPLTKGNSNNLTEVPEAIDLNMLDEMCSTCPAKQGIPQKIKRPTKLSGVTEVVNTGCGKMYVTINHLNGKILEVFCDTGKSGGCTAFTEGTSRLISIALRYGVPVGEILDQLSSVRCDNFRHQTGKNPELKGKSCPDVIGSVIKNMLKEIEGTVSIPKLQPEDAIEILYGNGEKVLLQALHSHGTEEVVIPIEKCPDSIKSVIKNTLVGSCPDCGNKLENSEGCCKCNICGFSKC